MEKEKTMDDAFQLYKIHRLCACVRGQTLQRLTTQSPSPKKENLLENKLITHHRDKKNEISF